ncbi:bifunctional UDP-N-acetylglucosamine diphosphorylase/glucosamine-1-phosphate N-acetyltransferase GlmU [Acidithiobacillus sp. AMEEHan]|uniref:bifunctional UDP-N-acetylglucosamine diphosphorylase/glucosamine-1-phosphate N-acetyltransferase GlmU n=1 Tax=Acidithiobacillus sp. AMEEHan TaxID=2994951 RepID=UPI0027E54AB9|nr:bifunctional UDP-N-acetylglucosamine diphosphorylase/glucosamine-1-phosphate N-acetyltransferase GlmU [Acidithiobacillus sp. AMEEHan]
MSIDIVILAAGKGTRMRSSLPKVLQPLAGKPLLAHVLGTARTLPGNPRLHVIVGHGAETVRQAFAHERDIRWYQQERQLGTGDAVRQALPGLQDAERVLVLYGDVPLLRGETLRNFLHSTPVDALGLCTGELTDPRGYGRILRSAQEEVLEIREERDCNAEERALREVNLGIMLFPAARLADWLARLQPGNAQGEYYLTDLVGFACSDDVPVHGFRLPQPEEALGVNDPAQLAFAERFYQRRQVEALQREGLRCADPERFDLRGTLSFGADCWIEPNVIVEGQVRLGDRVRIGAGVILRDVEIGNDVEILPYSMIEEAKIGAEARIGPFARIRPGTEIGNAAHVGNFVETKKVTLGAGSKANHLTYLGDAEIGSGVNIGAGVITCNYDGANKHRTEIGDDVFVGSDTQLIAPVKVGAGATIGAGSTITREVPAGGLTLSRSPQKSVPHWQRPKKSVTPA